MLEAANLARQTTLLARRFWLQARLLRYKLGPWLEAEYIKPAEFELLNWDHTFNLICYLKKPGSE